MLPTAEQLAAGGINNPIDLSIVGTLTPSTSINGLQIIRKDDQESSFDELSDWLIENGYKQKSTGEDVVKVTFGDGKRVSVP